MSLYRRLRATAPARDAEAPPRVARRSIAAVLVAAACTGAWMLDQGARTQHPPLPPASQAFATTRTTAPHPMPAPGTSAAPVIRPLGASVPVRIKIPAIQVDAPITLLNLDATRQLQVPPVDNRNLAGWYQGGPTPGTAGNAIMDGHVDTQQGPAVFYLLGALRKGNTIEIDRTDHTAALFTVDAIETYQKNTFPSTKVYAPTKDPQLRLITCGGGYTKTSGYLGNVVLYAHLTGSTHT